MAGSLFLYSIRWTNVLKFFGYPLIALGCAALLPFIASLIFFEFMISLYYLGISILSLILGWVLLKIPGDQKIRYNEAVVISCFIYLYAAAISAIPLLASGFSVMDAFFEAVSGITTTGLSMIDEWEKIPKTTYFARAWLQWIGGLGILMISLAFLVTEGHLTKRLGALESEPDDIIGGSKTHARGIFIIYCALTILGTIVLLILGTGFYDSLLLMFSSVSTGGFSPYRDSIAPFNIAQQAVMLFFAFVCAVSLPFYYKLWRARVEMTLQGVQVFGILALLIILSLILGGSWASWVLGVSSQTTTGFTSINVDDLSAFKKLSLCVSMLIGGGVGSTAGGFKVLRLILFFACLKAFIIKQCQTPHAVYKPSFLNIPVNPEHFQRALLMFGLFILTTILSWFCFVGMGYQPLDSLFEVASALGTVGLTTGVTRPEMPIFLKLILCVDMFLGRLEIIPWIIVFYPRTWIGSKLEES